LFSVTGRSAVVKSAVFEPNWHPNRAAGVVSGHFSTLGCHSAVIKAPSVPPPLFFDPEQSSPAAKRAVFRQKGPQNRSLPLRLAPAVGLWLARLPAGFTRLRLRAERGDKIPKTATTRIRHILLSSLNGLSGRKPAPKRRSATSYPPPTVRLRRFLRRPRPDFVGF